MMSGLQKEGPELTTNPGPKDGTSTDMLPAHILTQGRSIDNEEPNGFSILTAALSYAKRGWYVFPCRPEDKRPLTEHGFKDATLDPTQIREWWARHPEALIGVDCGRSGLVVIDCDVKNGTDGPGNWSQIVAAAKADITGALRSKTQSGGEHFIFQAPAETTISSSAGKLAPGIDVRARGGYIIMPPGKGARGVYRALGTWDHLPDYLPSSLVPHLLDGKEPPAPPERKKSPVENSNPGSVYGQAVLSRECDAVTRTLEGQRNNRLNQAAFSLGQLVGGKELDRQAVENALREAAIRAGLDKGETERTLQSGLEAGILQPRFKPVGKKPFPGVVPEAIDISEDLPFQERDWKSYHYIALLKKFGYTFRMNEMDDSIECNQVRMTDTTEAVIRVRLRNWGISKFNAARDAYVAEAFENRYHPIQQYLEGLSWDGVDHIKRFCSHFDDPTGNFAVFFRRWIIGAVARVYEPTQNRVLIIDGPQGIGKSRAVSWLASSMPKYRTVGAVNPENKDHLLRLAQIWIWEISELGNTTRKADVEAFKDFLTQQYMTARKPFDRYEIQKPTITSFIGTVNNVGGILNDPSGSRRFMAVYISRIDFRYSQGHPDQLWAQALTLYRQGEPWDLLPGETELAEKSNAEYTIEDPIIDYIHQYFKVDPASVEWFTPTIEIIDRLKTAGCRFTSDKAAAMAIAKAMYPMKPACKKVKDRTIRGYLGVKAL
jgi:putative DNA primase/helicase